MNEMATRYEVEQMRGGCWATYAYYERQTGERQRQRQRVRTPLLPPRDTQWDALTDLIEYADMRGWRTTDPEMERHWDEVLRAATIARAVLRRDREVSGGE